MIGLYVDRQLVFERSIIVDKSIYDAYQYVSCLNNHKTFSPWYLQDEDVKTSCDGGDDASCGFTCEWQTDNGAIGDGAEEILCIADIDRIETIVRLKDPFKFFSYSTIITEKWGSSQTKVIWKMKSNMPIPFNTLHYFFKYDVMYGVYLEEALWKLKQNVEAL